MAAGSHAENGNWADLHIAKATIITKKIHLNLKERILMTNTKKTSPIRLKRTVFIAPLLERDDR